VRKIVITREEVPELDSAESLSGKEVAVSRSTSYYESLTKLNERLIAQGKPPVSITIVPDTLEVADLMEMTAAGLLPGTVGDDWVAKLWVQIIKGLRLHPKASLREGAEIAWAVRPDNPKLLTTLNRAIAAITGNVNRWSDQTRSYLAELKQLLIAAQDADLKRFRDTVEILGALLRFPSARSRQSQFAEPKEPSTIV
jgi:membrane-bound lytic murein transglycosylase MltF